jgi:NAD(P)-dependent dehydrogenase (short-subunit alcohol dehydrogenase family)
MKSEPSLPLHGQKALVTGATSGLGRAIALQLARNGAEVVVHGRDVRRGTATVATITAAGGVARFVAADLSDPSLLGEFVADVGDLDVLVNNAGFAAFGPTPTISTDQFDALFASNVRAPFYLVAGFAPAMASRGTGSIINISSMAGQVGLDYGATKAALESMTRASAAEFSPRGVRVNAVAPGPVYTDGAAPERTTALGATTPLNRAAAVDEIANVVAFLAAPLASYVTGSTVAVDGDRSAVERGIASRPLSALSAVGSRRTP